MGKISSPPDRSSLTPPRSGMPRPSTSFRPLRPRLLLPPKPLPSPSAATAATLTTTSSSSTSDPDHDSEPPTSDVEKVYRIIRRYHPDPSKLARALLHSGVPLRPALVDRVLLRSPPALSLPLLSACSALRLPPPSSSALLRSLSRSRPSLPSALSLLRLAAPHSSPLPFLPLLRRFRPADLLASALPLLASPDPPDPSFFSALLDALCKSGATRHAASLFDDMCLRFPPTLRHFTSLLYGWCREGRLPEAKFVLVQMRRAGIAPDLVAYNVLLAGLAFSGRIADSRHLLAEIRSAGLQPNAISYTTLISGLCKLGRLDEAATLMPEMRRAGCDPDPVTYATMIASFSRCGRLPDAHRLLDELARDGPVPGAAAYFPVMVAHEKKEQLEECLELMGKMRQTGFKPDLSMYNVVIRLSCKLGELKQATTLWEELDASEHSPGADTFVILVNGFAQQGALVEACAHLKEMVARGLWTAPHYGTLKELFNSLLRAELLRLAEEVWSCLVRSSCELNVCAWTIWIHALFTRKHVKVVCGYCLAMMEAGLMPQPDTFARLMKGLKKLYNRRIAAEITEKVRAMAAERKVSFKMYKRRGVRLLDEKVKRRETEEGMRRRRVARRKGRENTTGGLEG